MNIFTIKLIVHKIFKEIIMTYQHLKISRLFILYIQTYTQKYVNMFCNYAHYIINYYNMAFALRNYDIY